MLDSREKTHTFDVARIVCAVPMYSSWRIFIEGREEEDSIFVSQEIMENIKRDFDADSSADLIGKLCVVDIGGSVIKYIGPLAPKEKRNLCPQCGWGL